MMSGTPIRTRLLYYANALVSSGIVGAIFRFVLFMRTDLVSDITWDSVPTMTWTTAEPSLYLIAACLPALRPLLKDFKKGTSIRSLGKRLLGSWKSKDSSQDLDQISLRSYPPSDVEKGRIRVRTELYLQRHSK